jgi:5-methylcytosine-specific restriction endonuclease McrA
MNGRNPIMLTEQQIRHAMKSTLSNRAASRFLNVSYPTYKMYSKMYIDQETGKSLFELHLNPSGKGIIKITESGSREPRLQELLKQGMSIESYSVDKLKNRLLHEGLLTHECNKCGFAEKRVIDLKVPILLNFKNGKKSDWTIENLEMICYNCYFLYVGDIYNNKQVRAMEDYTAPVEAKSNVDWELDEYYLKHFEEIGLINSSEGDGSEYISRL